MGIEHFSVGAPNLSDSFSQNDEKKRPEEEQDGAYALEQNKESQNPEEKLARKKREEEGERKKYRLTGVEKQVQTMFREASKSLYGAGLSVSSALALLDTEKDIFRKVEQEMMGTETNTKKAQLSGETDILFAHYNKREESQGAGEIKNT